MTNRLINGHPLYFDADADDNKRGVDVEIKINLGANNGHKENRESQNDSFLGGRK